MMKDEILPHGTSTARNLLYFTLIVVIWITAGSFITAALFSLVSKENILFSYAIRHANFFLLLFLIILFIHKIERIPLLSFMTERARFNLGGFLFGGAVLLASQIIQTTASVFILDTPLTFHRETTGTVHLMMIALALPLTTVQCLSEELLFRSFFFNLAKKSAVSPHIVSLFSAALFTLAHTTNTELTGSGQPFFVLLYYFLSGLFYMEIVFAYGGIEAALGAHIMNNLFITTIVNYEGSSIHSYPFFTSGRTDILLDLTLLILSSAVLLLFSHRKRRHP